MTAFTKAIVVGASSEGDTGSHRFCWIDQAMRGQMHYPGRAFV